MLLGGRILTSLEEDLPPLLPLEPIIAIFSDRQTPPPHICFLSQLQAIMASHVVVIDSSARRTVIKTTPGKPLSDVLQEACVKLGLDASCHGFKYANIISYDRASNTYITDFAHGIGIAINLSICPEIFDFLAFHLELNSSSSYIHVHQQPSQSPCNFQSPRRQERPRND